MRAAQTFRPSVVRLIFHDLTHAHFEFRYEPAHPETNAERETCARLRYARAASSVVATRSLRRPEGLAATLLDCAPVVGPGDAQIGTLCLFDAADWPLSQPALQRLSDIPELLSEWPKFPLSAVRDPEPDHRSVAAATRVAATNSRSDGAIDLGLPAGDINVHETPFRLQARRVAALTVSQAPWFAAARNTASPACCGGHAVEPTAGEILYLSPLEARQRQIDYMAQHDDLTGLMNRDRFQACLTERLDSLEHDGGNFALLYIDLDRLAVINKTLGHHAGDAVLVEVSHCLRAALREEHIVGRISGDEFAILKISAVSQPASSAALSQRLIEALTGPTWILGKLVEIGLSIVVVVAPTDGRDGQVVLKRAALALSRTKADGRITRRFYEPVMDAAAEARHSLEIDLRGTLSRGEFEVDYQPLVESATGQPTGAEALVRWRHPCKGLVSSGNLIGLAEETGLIVQLGERVLRRACRDAAAWPAEMRIAFNISWILFRQARFVEVVMHALAETGLSPERLELEITDTVLMKSLPQVVEALILLRRFGVRISLDDPGTGYSSLSYLRMFPLDKLKIDESFVQDLADPATVSILRAIIALNHGLGTTVTAEDIESEGQRAAVRDLRCTNLQGYLFGRPLAKDDFVRVHLCGHNRRAS